MSKKAQEASKGSIAIIRIRGITGIKKPVKDTLEMLRLYKKNFCVIVPDTQAYRGMINKVKDFVTWGELNDETLKKLENVKEKTKDKEGKEVFKKFYRLNPPIKGYGRKGIKVGFSAGGALGNRKEKINDLIERMLR